MSSESAPTDGICFEMAPGCPNLPPADERPSQASSDNNTMEGESEGNIKKDSDFHEMDADLWSKIPEELLEKIIAKLPLRFLFQAGALSKSWALKMVSGSFQNEISLSSRTRWSSYCPIYVGNEGLIGYDTVSRRCEKMLSLAYLPYPRADLISTTRGKISIAGPLMCFVDCDHCPNVYVTNVITKEWMLLPPRPDMSYPAIAHLLLVGNEAYMVILIIPLEAPCTQIYDSATKVWTVRQTEPAPVGNLPIAASRGRWHSSNRAWISSNNAWTNSAYSNGNLYVLWGYQYDGPCELLAYNVADGIWINIGLGMLHRSLGSVFVSRIISMSRILVCAESVMVVIRLFVSSIGLEDIRDFGKGTGKGNLIVYKLDTDSQQIAEVSRGPHHALRGVDLNEAAADTENIYFYQKLAPNSSVVVYNVPQKAWSTLPAVFDVQTFHDALKKRHQPKVFFQPTTFSFHPGQNPFLQV